jgi:hypothetical protein
MQTHFGTLGGGFPGSGYGFNDGTVAPLLSNGTASAAGASDGFFPSDLGTIGMMTHLITHPKFTDLLQLILLGLVAELTRRSFKHVTTWARKTFFITTVHATNDDSYDWLMCESSEMQFRYSSETRQYCSLLGARQKVEGEMSQIVSQG